MDFIISSTEHGCKTSAECMEQLFEDSESRYRQSLLHGLMCVNSLPQVGQVTPVPKQTQLRIS